MDKPTTGLRFKNQGNFIEWLREHHDSEEGHFIFLYKKGYENQGITYNDALTAALCYGWIDAVTYSYDQEKFLQYFAPRRKDSNWSLRNIILMKTLIESGKMTEAGLKYFDLDLIDQIELLKAKEDAYKEQLTALPEDIEEYFREQDVLELFHQERPSMKKNYLGYILEAKQEKTRLRRCEKVTGILKGEKNNL